MKLLVARTFRQFQFKSEIWLSAPSLSDPLYTDAMAQKRGERCKNDGNL